MPLSSFCSARSSQLPLEGADSWDKPPNSKVGVTVLLRVPGISSSRNSPRCVGRASGNCINTSKRSKAFIYFRISRRGTDGDVSSPFPFMESRKGSFLAKLFPWGKVQFSFPQTLRQRDHATEVSGKTGPIKGSLCMSLTRRLCAEKRTSLVLFLDCLLAASSGLYGELWGVNQCVFASSGVSTTAAREPARLSTGLSKPVECCLFSWFVLIASDLSPTPSNTWCMECSLLRNAALFFHSEHTENLWRFWWVCLDSNHVSWLYCLCAQCYTCVVMKCRNRTGQMEGKTKAQKS